MILVSGKLRGDLSKLNSHNHNWMVTQLFILVEVKIAFHSIFTSLHLMIGSDHMLHTVLKYSTREEDSIGLYREGLQMQKMMIWVLMNQYLKKFKCLIWKCLK